MPRPHSRHSQVSSNVTRPKRATMQDIAAAAGVHVMTVSNALGNIRSVSPTTREKVLRIARELNYVPNTAARALAAGKTGVIAVFSGNLNEPYYANMVHLLSSQMDADGYKLTIHHRPHDVGDLLNDTGSVAVDGAIGIDMYHMVEKFRPHPAIPCVSIGTYEQELMDCVIVDLSDAVKRALRIMLNEGRQRIAYLVNAAHLSLPAEVRARSYLEFMQRCGRPPEIINSDTSIVPLTRERFRAYLGENGCPDGLLCLNDEVAMCAYQVLRQQGYKVPDDVLLVGCDGQLHMEYFDTPLSTIAQPMEEMCALAWQFLRQRIAEPGLPLQHATLRGKLVVRESLRPPQST